MGPSPRADPELLLLLLTGGVSDWAWSLPTTPNQILRIVTIMNNKITASFDLRLYSCTLTRLPPAAAHA